MKLKHSVFLRSVIVGCVAFSLATMLSSCDLLGIFGKKQPLFVVVNVLDPELFDDAHIPGSINVPMEDVDTFAQKNWSKNTGIVFYCANYKCTSSNAIAKNLKQKGYLDVVAYEGGMADWKHRGFPVAGPAKSGYLDDYEQPEGFEVDEGVEVIDGDQLKQKMEKFGILK